MIQDLNLRCRAGFTLAEVLITLGIIGVVAAMTMPVLINNYRISQWETALKKAYTVMSNGFKQIIADSGCDNLECTGIFVNTGDDDTETADAEFSANIDKAVRKTFNVLKTYNVGEYGTVTYKQLKGNELIEYSDPSFVIILNDGMVFRIVNQGCRETAYLRSCASIFLDINGDKGPNQLGKDAFLLGNVYENGQIAPQASNTFNKAYPNMSYAHWRLHSGQCGKPDTKLDNDTTTSISGQNCLARIMENGWKMDYLH